MTSEQGPAPREDAREAVREPSMEAVQAAFRVRGGKVTYQALRAAYAIDFPRAAAPVAGSEPHPQIDLDAKTLAVFLKGTPGINVLANAERVAGDLLQQLEDAGIFLALAPAERSVAGSEPPKCADCGAELNEGEAKVFTVCDACWNIAYGRSVAGSEDAAPPTYPRGGHYRAERTNVCYMNGPYLMQSVGFAATPEDAEKFATALESLAARSLGEQPSDPTALISFWTTSAEVIERRAIEAEKLAALAYRDCAEQLRAALAAPGGRADTEDTP